MSTFPLSSESSRRRWLQSTACGFGYLAFKSLCADGVAAEDAPAVDRASADRNTSLVAKPGHLPARAKRIIFIFMQGGPSQVDTFDYKPRLAKEDGKKVEFDNARVMKRVAERVFASPWKFSRHGQTGRWVSELFPHMARHVDDLCFIHSMHTNGVAHGPATLFLHTGATNLIRPSMGSWVTYGLGTENQNLPGFMTIHPTPAKGGPRNYGNAFLPTVFQGTAIGRAGVPVGKAGIKNIQNPSLGTSEQRRRFEFLQALNQEQIRGRHDRTGNADPDGDMELDAVLGSYELAYRMQGAAPAVLDLASETRQTLDRYGIGEKATEDFGRQCLMARRFAEAGVRYIQVNYADNANTPRWDQHSNLQQHEKHALAVDKPVAALLADLKARGLLEDTLVWWGGEFGRTPFAQGRDGRDHNPKGFTIWLAGGGVRPGLAYGATDEFGDTAVENKVHMHDLHATILHLLGLDHQQLTYRYAGRNFRLTDVHGSVVKEIMA